MTTAAQRTARQASGRANSAATWNHDRPVPAARELPPRVPCLSGYSHRRQIVFAADGSQTGTCRLCGDVRAYPSAEFRESWDGRPIT